MNETMNTIEPRIAHSECYAQVFSRLFFGDCLIESDKIKDGSVDLILTDLPYGNMNTDGGRKLGINGWDFVIEPKKVYEIANRILRKNGKLVLFSQEPYTSRMITEAIPNIPFSYRMIWEKDNFANALGVNKAMVSFYEDILLFSKTHDLERSHPLIDYFTGELSNTGMNQSDINKLLGNKMGGHYFTNGVQFCTPTEPNYKKLQETGYFQKPYEEIKAIDDQFKKEFASTFNLWEGGKFKSNILKYKKDYNGYHPTQKPILLLEDLIKTFSNEGDLVVDLTMGSGSTGVACKNTNRSFIGIEKDENYFKIAE
ncbi:MAG: site-specific DNA-methyltransferase, partial [Pseudomonadota bacterium]|nr:site-specific DNA-methyltransferase [Pseudomonadota bacterium]